MGCKTFVHLLVMAFQCAHGTLQIDGVPQDYRCHHQIKARRRVPLLLETAVADFAERMTEYRPGHGVTCFPLVQSSLRASAQFDALQPVQNE